MRNQAKTVNQQKGATGRNQGAIRVQSGCKKGANPKSRKSSKCSKQVALRKCSATVAPCKRFAHVLCASSSVQVALRKCFVQVLCASCSAQVAAQVLPELWEGTSSTIFVLKKCDFQPNLRECAPRTTIVLKSCDFRRSCGSTLRLYLKAAIFQPEPEHAPRTTFKCDFQARAAADRGESRQ